LHLRNAVPDDNAATGTPVALRRRVREALAAGLLPLARVGSVGRRGSRQPCFICQEVIVPSELEREIQLAQRRPVVVHEPCYLIWRVETMTKVAADEANLGR